MTQKDKELLLKDLCTRLPYGVKGIITYDRSNTTFTVEGIDNNVLHLSDAEECHVEDFKPYLRPMSSMTDGEQKELEKIIDGILGYNAKNYFHSEDEYNWETLYNACDWLNAHHFDYHGLIEKGLALEAPEGMYEY